MFKNYLKTALRSFWKNRFFSSINIIGLTVGFSCCLLIGLYIQHELSYDDFQKKGDRITRVIMEYGYNGTSNKNNNTSTKVAPVFKRTFPEVESAIRMYQDSRIVKYEDKLFNEPRFLHADSTFFDIFSFSLLKGSAKTALDGPNKVVLTSSSAKKYFGSENAVGKTIFIGANANAYEVTGIMEDCPTNSQLKFDFLASFSSLHVSQESTYWNANFTTYFLLKDEASIASLQQKIPAFMKKEMAAEKGTYVLFELEPFKKIHLYSTYEGFEPNNSITYIYIMAVVALLILAIACFTYINLGTASSMERAKEVGVRKVMGAGKNQIFWQYIGESLMLSVFALLLSLVIVGLSLPYFNQLADKQLHFSSLFTPVNLIYCLSILACISLVAGSYPALILSGFQPIRVLKGTFKNTGSGLIVRKSLIVFQFMISVFLIVSTFIIQDQLHYIRNKKLGYDREHVLILPIDQKIAANIKTIKTEFKTNPDILSVSKATNAPTYIRGGYTMQSAEMPAESGGYSVRGNPIDEDYIQTTGLEIIAGSDFTAQDIADVIDKENQQDRVYHFILNESAVKLFGWKPEEAIGKRISLKPRPGIVKGVVKDFHFESLHDPIRPLVLFPETWTNILLVKISGERLPATITSLEAKWKTLVPHRPFEYHFMDDTFNKMYNSEMRLGKVLNIFAAIAILLACLGLFGLSSFTAQQRRKEIGIRKVLGASLTHIVTILSKEFIILACISFVIAFPVAWWAMNKWLQDFTYRVNIGWWIFLVAGLATLLLALFTVGFRAIKAGRANPAESLRTE
jgi:putative ABC transport system permease protein